jgi:casein kinase II subunit beta
LEDSESIGGWVSWFCELEGHEFFAEVDEDYIRDCFNLYGLKKITSRYE